MGFKAVKRVRVRDISGGFSSQIWDLKVKHDDLKPLKDKVLAAKYGI